MKKTYHTSLLTGGIAIILAYIAAFVLQDFFGRSFLTLSFQLDTFVFMAIAFIMILQFKSFDKIIAIILVIYGAFNILYGVTGTRPVSLIINSVEFEVIFVLGLLLGHALFEISSLFLLLHTTQTKFETKFTKRFIMVSLIVSFIFLAAVSPFVTLMKLDSVLRVVFALIAIAVVYISMVLMVKDKPIVSEEPVVVNNQQSKLNELERLYQRGIISDEEYQTRLKSIESVQPKE